MDDRCVRSGSGYVIRRPPSVALHVDVVAFSLRKMKQARRPGDGYASKTRQKEGLCPVFVGALGPDLGCALAKFVFGSIRILDPQAMDLVFLGISPPPLLGLAR
jgi:hypothetical protein